MGRVETLAIANMLASNKLRLGSVEFNVVGVGWNADIIGLLQPLEKRQGQALYQRATETKARQMASWISQPRRKNSAKQWAGPVAR